MNISVSSNVEGCVCVCVKRKVKTFTSYLDRTLTETMDHHAVEFSILIGPKQDYQVRSYEDAGS